MNRNSKTYLVDPNNFLSEEYSSQDTSLVNSTNVDTKFEQGDYIEYYVLDNNSNIIYPSSTTPLLNYTIQTNDVVLNPEQDLENIGITSGEFNILYRFYRKRLSSYIDKNYYIEEISSDRTEIRLNSNEISETEIISSTNEFIQYREDSAYFVDFTLNFGNNKTLIANNLKLDIKNNFNTILVKLYNPLPADINVKDKLWVVEEISSPLAYTVEFEVEPIEIPNNNIQLSKPNFNIEGLNQLNVSDQSFSYNNLVDTTLSSSANKIQNLLNKKEIDINIDYSNFSNFVHFSSAQTRIENFYYKVGLIESYSSSISSIDSNLSSSLQTGNEYSSSIASFESQIENIIKNFDGYENYLYNESGSFYHYPKSNSTYPYTLYSTSSAEAVSWYNTMIASASSYDEHNQDYLKYIIPEYLREDPNNAKYELFIDMIGQHYDNVWVYIKDVGNRFNADNRINYGISKDLVADAIKDFGVNLYNNKYSDEDLFTAFLGLTPSGSLFTNSKISTNLPASSDTTYIDTLISSSNDNIPLDDANKRLYKRIYHNLPFLLKSKGTVKGLRALITSYGIPDTILRINEFGGKDKINSQDWDLKQRISNYAFNTSGSLNLSTSFEFNSDWDMIKPGSIQFRIKPNVTQSNGSTLRLWRIDDSGATSRSELSISYNTSSDSNYDKYATLYFTPDTSSPNTTASVYIPLYNGEWWSIMTNIDNKNNRVQLFAGSKNTKGLNFYNSSSWVNTSLTSYKSGSTFYLPGDAGGTGSLYNGLVQELRYYTGSITEENFKNYILNPLSIKAGNESDPHKGLVFRGALGTNLISSSTDSKNSIHPKVTGSNTSFITSSFTTGSAYSMINSLIFDSNTELIFQDQLPSGIKNRVTDKIKLQTSSLASSDVELSDNNEIISPLKSLQTYSEQDVYTQNIDYLEVAFSPQDQINDDINSQLGYFNIGEYIGDPRQISSSLRTYNDLDSLRKDYFEKYSSNYNLVDFVQLISYFDNSLFKSIKDFVPANTSLSSGIVIKQHLLERNRQRPAQVSYTDETYSGSIKSFPSNYSQSSKMYDFSGGTGGSFEQFNGLTNGWGVTQSWSETLSSSLSDTSSLSFPGPATFTRNTQKEFYDGELSGSQITITTQSLNPECHPYLTINNSNIRFNPLFFSSDIGFTDGTLNEESFISNKNQPASGDAWILHNGTKPTYIKLAETDINNIFVRDFLFAPSTMSVSFPEGIVKYHIEGTTVYSNSVLLNLSGYEGNVATASINGGTEQFFLKVEGSASVGAPAPTIPDDDNIMQGFFHSKTRTYQAQTFRVWGTSSLVSDPLNFMKLDYINKIPGSLQGYTSSGAFLTGSYHIQRTPNVPLIFDCSITYSSSFNDFSGTAVILGTYHSASNYTGVGLTDQDFTLNLNTSSGVFIPSPKITNLNSAYFENYSNLIPGNSGSGVTDAGGHPQIKTAGTASLDLYFPSLTLGGTFSAPAETGSFLPLSASGVNSFNNDYLAKTGSDVTALGNPVMELTSAEASNFGIVKFIVANAETYGEENPQLLGSPTGVTTCNRLILYPSLTFTASSSLNITSSFQYRKNGGGWTSIERDFASSGSLGTWSLNAIIDLTLIPSDTTIEIRPTIKSPDTFDYTMTEWDLGYSYTNEIYYEPGPSPNPNDETQFFNLNGLEQTGSNAYSASLTITEDDYGKVDTQVFLKSTSSLGERTITSSIKNTNQTIYPGITLTFPDSPILSIENTSPGDSDTTVNVVDEMYFIEYSMSNFQPGTVGGLDEIDVEFIESGDTGTKLFISQSIIDTNPDYILTGSLYVQKGNSNNTSSFGNNIVASSFIVPDETSTGSFSFTSSYQQPYNALDTFRLGVSVNKSLKSSLNITSYTMSIYPDTSVNATLTGSPALNNYKVPTGSVTIINTYFGDNILPFNLALDCQPLLNNVDNYRGNNNIFKVDYSNISGPIVPVNFNQIIERTAENADVPKLNYSAYSHIVSKYLGTKSESARYNVWSPTDKGTFGQLPNVELRDAYFGYFNGIENPYPNLNDTIKLDIQYLVDEQENALPPSLNNSSQTTFERVFPTKGKGRISVDSSNNELKKLNNQFVLNRVGSYPTPIMYSQTSSRDYSPSIPLTGSGRISRYDNNDSSSIDSYAFTSVGTCSVDTSNATASFNYIIDPSQSIEYKGYNTYNGVYTGNGTITFGGSNDVSGSNLNNSPKVLLETQVVTSYLYNSLIKSRGFLGIGSRFSSPDEVNLTLKLYSQRGNLPFKVKDIKLSVLRNNGEILELGSVINESWVKFVSNKTNRNKFKLNSNNEAQIAFASEFAQFLRSKGINTEGGDILYKNPEILSLIWTIVADSDNTIFYGGDTINWQLTGSATPSNTNEPDTVFFPLAHTEPYTPSKLSIVGSKDYLLENDNTGSAPFWVYSGSAGGGSTIHDRSVLVMSSSNINEAYGGGYYQGRLEYNPGASEYFPGGVEPRSTTFDNIENPIEFKKGDEIRFGNNENYTYIIQEVWSPQSNIENDGKGRIKVRLNKEVPEDINKDFFLVRRFIPSPNTIYLEGQFPYGNTPTGYINSENIDTKGILYPEFPTEYLENSASILINNLISKGVIK